MNNDKNSLPSDTVSGIDFNDTPLNQERWTALLERKPEWMKLFMRKPELFEPLASDLEWAEQLANDEKWNKLFAGSPEWAIVSAVELKKIDARRKQSQKYVDDKGEERNAGYGNKDLVGLAFSGGGIRSASFGLGVLEALKDCDLLRRIDYLSTVSGGGYIGAWLSANCKRAAKKGMSSWLAPETDWNESVRHLRRYSNYLSPMVGFFSADTWTMATIWLRNTLLVQLTIILGIAVLLSLPPLLLFSLFEWWPEAENWSWLIIALAIVSVAGIAGNNWRLNRDKISSLDSDIWWKGALLALVCLIIAFIAIKSNLDPFLDESYFSNRKNLLVDIPMALLLVAAGFFLLPGIMKLVNPKHKMNYSQAWVQWLVVLPTMLVGFVVAAILWRQSQSSKWSSFGDYFTQAWAYSPFLFTVMFVSLFLFSFCCTRSGSSQGQTQVSKAVQNAFALLMPLPAMLVLYASIIAIMLLQEWISEWLYGWIKDHGSTKYNVMEESEKVAFVVAPTLVFFSFSLTIIMLLGMLGRQTTEGIREWWSRFGAWLAIYGFGWMVISIVAVYGPWLFDEMFTEAWTGITIGGSWIGTTLAGVFAAKSGATEGSSNKDISARILDVIAKIAPFVFIAGLLIVVSKVLNAIIMKTSESLKDKCPGVFSDWGGFPLRHWASPDCELGLAALIVGLLCLTGLLLLGWRVDVNEFSFNAFYRSRLARCYLGATRRPAERNPQNFTGFDDKDDMPLSDLAKSDGPLHIINCALNLGGSRDLELHTRHSTIYTFSPLYYGSGYKIKGKGLPGKGVEIGYTATNKYGNKFYQPTLGQAIAVSGAAANPNMGYHTSPVTAFLMTLFNVRLGGWFPNPHKTGVNRSSPRFGLKYLLMELFGLANEHSTYLSVSDGGHFENLAAYELIKRKCKVIIIIDAECDPKFQFEGLGTLIRMCEVDFGVKIKIDVSSIRPDGESPWSRNRCAVGEIKYRDEPEGILIYIKASMNGHEGTAVMQYKLAHPDFPHDTTADQFYGEDQFESYRSLGRDITRRTFDRVMHPVGLFDSKIEGQKEQDIIEYAKRLKHIFSPMLPNIGQFSHHTDQLMKLLSEINEKQNLRSLGEQLSIISSESTDVDCRTEFHFCNRLIQLMESVYHDLNLEETWEHPDNMGWSTVFTQWARSEKFQKAWTMTDRNYGLRFRYFCKYHLNLPFSEESSS